MKNLQLAYSSLKPGDHIAIIAPSGRCQDEILPKVKSLLADWQLKPIIPENLFGPDLLCANTAAERFKQLHDMLHDPVIKAIWCLRGGYGVMHLLPMLAKTRPPQEKKVVIGFSDITALHLFLQKQWQWPSLHGPSARQVALNEIAMESISALKHMLFQTQTSFSYPLIPLNQPATATSKIESCLTGGNLCLVQASMGTPWQVDAKNKLLVLEEVNERGYRVDRMLEQLQQAGVFAQCDGVLIGDCIGGDEPAGPSLTSAVIERFAAKLTKPVFRLEGVGHGSANHPLMFGVGCVVENDRLCQRFFI